MNPPKSATWKILILYHQLGLGSHRLAQRNYSEKAIEDIFYHSLTAKEVPQGEVQSYLQRAQLTQVTFSTLVPSLEAPHLAFPYRILVVSNLSLRN